MTNDDLQSNESDIHEQIARVVQFLRRATRFWMAPVGAVVLGLIASAAFYFLKKPTYKSETVILYSEGIRQSEGGEDGRSGSRAVSTRLKEILTSRAELANIVNEFKLYPKVAKAGGVVDAVDELRRHVEFKAPGGDTFSIAFEGSTPEEAKLVTTRLAKAVIDQDATLRSKQAVVARDFLELEKMGTESQLKDVEQALASFMAAHPRFALDATPLATGAAIRATMGGGAQAGPVTPNMPFMPRSRAAAPGAPASSTRGVAAAPASREAAEEQVKAGAALDAAQARLADLSARFTPQYPDVKNAQAEVDRAKARVAAAAVAAGASRVETKPAGAPQSGGEGAAITTAPATPAPAVRAVRAALAPAGIPPRNAEDEKNVVGLETDWVKLTRAVTEARQHQDQVESALFKAGILANSEAGGHGVQVSVMNPAFLPERPVPPGRSTIVGLIMAAALVLGILGSLLAAALDDRIHDGRELATLAPVLVAVPRQLVGRANG